MMHFKTTLQGHPFNIKKNSTEPSISETTGDLIWDNPTQNHVWTSEELTERLSEQPKHQPTTVLDRIIWGTVRGCYHGFNFVTRFDKQDPSPASCEYRLLLLESIAGVPGMVAGSIRHFESLRDMRRDYGWIHTLLEEAENERMHLLICIKMFKPGLVVRSAVIGAQSKPVFCLFCFHSVKGLISIFFHSVLFPFLGCYFYYQPTNPTNCCTNCSVYFCWLNNSNFYCSNANYVQFFCCHF